MKEIHIHLISDSTGETLSSMSRAVMSQFDEVHSHDHMWSLIRTESQMEKVINEIKKNPGIVIYTILRNDIKEKLVSACKNMQLPCISALSNIIRRFSSYLGMEAENSVGRQYHLNDDYFSKVEAIHYTLYHDDGQHTEDLDEADIILIGASRTSKTPTSVYLSCKGYKTANIPFVIGCPIPENLFTIAAEKQILIIGLTINPIKLVQIRKSRIMSLKGETLNNNYIDEDKIKKEILASKKLFNQLKCPVIDVTKRSVEETAAKISQFYQELLN